MTVDEGGVCKKSALARLNRPLADQRVVAAAEENCLTAQRGMTVDGGVLSSGGAVVFLSCSITAGST